MQTFAVPTSLSADALQPALDAAAQANGLPIVWQGTAYGTVNTTVHKYGVDIPVTGDISIQAGQVLVNIEAGGGTFDGQAVNLLQPAVQQAVQNAQNAQALQQSIGQGLNQTTGGDQGGDQGTSVPPQAPPPPAKKKSKAAAPPQPTEQTTMADGGDSGAGDLGFGTIIDSSTGTQTELYTGQTYTPGGDAGQIPPFSVGDAGGDGATQMQQGFTATANAGVGPDAATGGYPIGYVDPSTGLTWNGAYWSAGSTSTTGDTTYPNFEGPGATAQGTAPTTYPNFEGPGATPDQGTAQLQQGLSGGQAAGIPPFETSKAGDAGTDQLAKGFGAGTTSGADSGDLGTQQLKQGFSSASAIDAAMQNVPYDPNAAKLAAAAITAAGGVATQAIKSFGPQAPPQGPPRPYYPGQQQVYPASSRPPQQTYQPPPAQQRAGGGGGGGGGGLNLPPISLGGGQPQAQQPPAQPARPATPATGAPKPNLPLSKPLASSSTGSSMAPLVLGGVAVVGLAAGAIAYGVSQSGKKKKKPGDLLLGKTP